MFGTLQIGHTIHVGIQRLQCWPFPNTANRTYHGYNLEDFVFTRPPGVVPGGMVCADSGHSAEPGQRLVWSVKASFHHVRQN